jgi:hypothetical protein
MAVKHQPTATNTPVIATASDTAPAAAKPAHAYHPAPTSHSNPAAAIAKLAANRTAP